MKRLLAGILCFCFMLTMLSGVGVYAAFGNETATVYMTAQRKNNLVLDKNGAAADGDVLFDKNVNRYTVSAVSESGDESYIKVEVSTLLKVATSYASGKVTPSVTIKTDIASVTMDGEFVEALSKKDKKNEIYFEIKKTDEIEDRILKRLMTDAKAEINYCFTDYNGKKLDLDGEFDVEIPFTSLTTDNIHIYEVRDAMVVNMKAKYKDNLLSYSGSAAAQVLISEENRLEIKGRTLDLQGTISLVFYAAIEGIDPNCVKMLFWESEQSRYIVDTADRIVELKCKDKNGYRFEYTNITSKDMSKKIYARLVAETEDGTLKYSAAPREPYSVVQYAENMMENKSLKPLLVKMLNYGAAAQEYFGSEKEPANSVLKPGEKATDFTKTYESEDATIEELNGGKSAAYIAGKTISLEGDISINYYVLGTDAADESGILFWNEYDYAMTKEHTVGTESRKVTESSTNGAYKVFSYPNIVSRQMFNSVYARAYTKVNGEYCYSDIDKYSVRDYAANQLEKNADFKLVKVLRCLMLYGEEAKKYFNSLD